MASFLDLFGVRLDRELGSADRDQLFTTARRKAAVNEAQLEFAKLTECYTRFANVTLADNTREYNLGTAIAAGDFLWVAKGGAEYHHTDAASTVTYRSGEDDFPRFDLDTLNREHPSWRAALKTRYPDGWYLRDDDDDTFVGFKVPPKIGAGESALMKVPYVAKPADLSADGDVPFNGKLTVVPWHQALTHYAAALLEPLRKGYQAEQRQRQLFAGLVADYLQKQRPKGGSVIVLAQDYHRPRRSGGGYRGSETF